MASRWPPVTAEEFLLAAVWRCQVQCGVELGQVTVINQPTTAQFQCRIYVNEKIIEHSYAKGCNINGQ